MTNGCLNSVLCILLHVWSYLKIIASFRLEIFWTITFYLYIVVPEENKEKLSESWFKILKHFVTSCLGLMDNWTPNASLYLGKKTGEIRVGQRTVIFDFISLKKLFWSDHLLRLWPLENVTCYEIVTFIWRTTGQGQMIKFFFLSFFFGHQKDFCQSKKMYFYDCCFPIVQKNMRVVQFDTTNWKLKTREKDKNTSIVYLIYQFQ